MRSSPTQPDHGADGPATEKTKRPPLLPDLIHFSVHPLYPSIPSFYSRHRTWWFNCRDHRPGRDGLYILRSLEHKPDDPSKGALVRYWYKGAWYIDHDCRVAAVYLGYHLDAFEWCGLIEEFKQ